MNTRPNFHTDHASHDLIMAIVDRAEHEGLIIYKRLKSPRMTAVMDLTACHNSNPLRLGAFLAAPLGDFGHDFCGIQAHMDRDTGELTDCFSPRFTAYQPATS